MDVILIQSCPVERNPISKLSAIIDQSVSGEYGVVCAMRSCPEEELTKYDPELGSPNASSHIGCCAFNLFETKTKNASKNIYFLIYCFLEIFNVVFIFFYNISRLNYRSESTILINAILCFKKIWFNMGGHSN